MARAGLTTDRIVAAATDLIDEEGRADSLTLARLADHFGVRTPSLYSHVGGVDDIVYRVGLRALEELGETCRRAAMGRSGGAALAAVADAYRDFVRRRPGTYPLTQMARPDDLVWEEATRRVLEPFLAILEGVGVTDDDAIHAIRVLRSALHGFAGLEAGGGFGLDVDVDESFRRLVEVVAGLEGGHPAWAGGRIVAYRPV